MEEGGPESFKVKIIGDEGENISAFSALVGDTKNLDIGSQPVTLEVSLDNALAVHDRFRGFHGYVVVFDFADAESYNNVRERLMQIERYATGVHRIVLVGLNSDTANPIVDSDAAAEFAASEGLSYIEASASKNRNIDVIFETLAREMDQTLKNKAVEPRVVLDNEKLPLAVKVTPAPIVPPPTETKKIDASSVVFTSEVADIKNNGDLIYLQKLENLAALRAKNPFPLDEAFMHKFAEGENLNISLDESITVVWKKVQDYNELLEKYKLPNIHASEFSQIQEALKLRAAEEIPAKISEVINGDGTYLSKLKKLKGLYWSYRGLGDVKPTEFTCSEAELNIDQEDNLKALAQLAEYKVLFQLLDIDVANFPVFKNAEENVQRRVQEKYNNDIDAIINGSGSPLEKLKSAKEVFDRNGSNKFLTHEKMAGLVDVLKAIEFSSETNYIDRLAQLKEYQVLCVGMKLSQGEAVIKEKIKNLKFDLKADIVFLEIQSIHANQKLSAAEKLSRLNLLLGQCSEHGIKLSSATKAYFNETVKELSNLVAYQLIETSRQKFLEVDWELFSKDPTKTSATKYAAELTMFVQKMILGNTDKVAASLCIGQWLHIANECVKNRDYHSAHAICQAFTTSAVSRVMEVFATEKEKQILEQLRIMFPAKEGDVSRYAIVESAQVEKDVVPSLIYPATQIGNAYAAAEGIGGKADPEVIAKIMSGSQDIQRNSGIAKKKEFNEMQFNEFVSDDGLYALSLETMSRLSDEEKQAEKAKVGGVRKDFDTLSAEDEKELRSLVHPLEVRMLAAQVFKIFDEHASKGVKEKAEKDRKGFVDRIVELDVGKRPKLTEESKSTSSKEINRKIGEIKELLLKAVPGVNNEEFNDKMIDLIQSLELKAQTTKSGEDKKNVIERNVQILRAVAHEFNIDIPKADYLADTPTIEVGALKTPQPSGFFANIQQRIVEASNFVASIFRSNVETAPEKKAEVTKAKEVAETLSPQQKWERDLNENVNGFLRDFYTERKPNFFEVFEKQFLALGEKINDAKLGFTHQELKAVIERLKVFVQGIENVNKQTDKTPLQKAEEIASFVEKNREFYVDAAKINEWVQALSQKFPEKRAEFKKEFNPNGVELSSYIIKFVQWLPKYPPHLANHPQSPEEAKALTVPFKALVQNAESALQEPGRKAETTISAASAAGTASEEKSEILQSITWSDYWKAYDEIKAEMEKSISEKGKEDALDMSPFAIHGAVGRELKIGIPDLDVIAKLNRYNFELKVNELVGEGKVKGPTTIETDQKSAVARVMQELVHINNTFYEDFVGIEPKVIAFTAAHPEDELVQEFHERYYAILNFFNKVKAITETDPIKKAEIIAQMLIDDEGKIAKDIVRFTELKTQVSAKYPEQFMGKSGDESKNVEARAFDQAIILPSQWVSKAVIVLDAVKKERIDGAEEASHLFKEAASLANKTETVTSEAVAVKLERLVEGTSLTSTSKMPSAVLNMQAEEVEKFLRPEFVNLSTIQKNRSLEQVYDLMKAYVEKISGKGGRELTEKEVGNIKIILTNLSKLSDFVKLHDPSFAERQKEIPLGNAIGQLHLAGHKELSEQCGKVLIQFNNISVDKTVQAEKQTAASSYLFPGSDITWEKYWQTYNSMLKAIPDGDSLNEKDLQAHRLVVDQLGIEIADLEEIIRRAVENSSDEEAYKNAFMEQAASKIAKREKVEEVKAAEIDKPLAADKRVVSAPLPKAIVRPELRKVATAPVAVSKSLETIDPKQIDAAFDEIINQQLKVFVNVEKNNNMRYLREINEEQYQQLKGAIAEINTRFAFVTPSYASYEQFFNKLDKSFRLLFEMDEDPYTDFTSLDQIEPDDIELMGACCDGLDYIIRLRNLLEGNGASFAEAGGTREQFNQMQKQIFDFLLVDLRSILAQMKIPPSNIEGILQTLRAFSKEFFLEGSKHQPAALNGIFEAIEGKAESILQHYKAAEVLGRFIHGVEGEEAQALAKQLWSKNLFFFVRQSLYAGTGEGEKLSERAALSVSEAINSLRDVAAKKREVIQRNFQKLRDRLSNTEFKNETLKEALLEKIMVLMLERKFPEEIESKQWKPLIEFIQNNIAKFSGEGGAVFGNYDAMVRNAPGGVKELAARLFNLTKAEFYSAIGKEAPPPKQETASERVVLPKEQEVLSHDTLEHVFGEIKLEELRVLLLNKVKFQKTGFINSTELGELKKVVEELNEKFQSELPSYEDYTKLLKNYSRTVANEFEIEEDIYEKARSLFGINEVLGGAAAIGEANDTMPVSSGAPAPKKGIFANIFGRNKADGKKPLFGMDAPLSELEELAASKKVLDGRDLAKVNRLLDEIRNEANIEREDRNDPLYYPVDAMERILRALAKHYQTPGLNVEAIQGMFPAIDGVNKYLKQEEAKLDAMIDALDLEDFADPGNPENPAGVFSPYFQPQDKQYDSYYESRGVDSEVYKRQVMAYNVKDIIKKAYVVGISSHGGQSVGVQREQMACDAAEAFLRQTKESQDKNVVLIRAILHARSTLALMGIFARGPQYVSKDFIVDEDAVTQAVPSMREPSEKVEQYHLEFDKLIDARIAYVAQKQGIQNHALAAAIAVVQKNVKYFNAELPETFILRTNLLISKNAEMPDAFLEKCAEFQKFVIDEVGYQYSPEVLKALIIAVVKGDISYDPNPENVSATIDDNLVKAIRYQLELANAIKKMTDATPAERDALVAEKQEVDQHVKQLSDKLKQIRVDAQRKDDAIYERVQISEDELRELVESEPVSETESVVESKTQPWLRANRPAQAEALAKPEPSRYQTLTSELQKLLAHPENIFKPGQTGKIVLRGDQLEGISADFQGTSEPKREVIIRYFGEGERNAINVEDIRERIKFLADVAREYHLDPLGAQQGRINSIQERYLAMCGVGSDFERIGNAAGKEFKEMTVKAQEMFLNMEKELLGIVAPNASLSKGIKEFENKSKFLLMRRGRPTVIHVMADGLVNVHIPKGKVSFPSDFRASENPGTNPNSVLEVIGHVDGNNQLEVQATVSRAVSFSVLKLSKKEQAIQRRRLNYENAKEDVTNLLKLMDLEDGQTVTIQSTSLVTPLMKAPTEKATLGRFLGFASETRQVRDHHVALEMVNGETLEVDGKKVTVKINHVNISVKDPKERKGRVNKREQQLINARGFAKYIENQYESLKKQFPELENWLKENCYREATPEIKELEKELRGQYEKLRKLVTVTPIKDVDKKAVEAAREDIRKLEAKLADQYEKLYADVKSQWAENPPVIPAEFANNKQLQYFVDAQRLYYSGKYLEAGYSYVLATQMARSNELARVVVAKNCKSTNDRTNWSLNHDKLALKYEEEHNGEPLLSTTPGFEKYVQDHLQLIHEEGAGMDGYTRSRPGARGSVVNNPWGHDPDKRDSLVSKWKIKPGLRQFFKLLLKRDRTPVEESVVKTTEAMHEGEPEAKAAMVEATRAAELERKAHAAEDSMLRALEDFENGDELKEKAVAAEASTLKTLGEFERETPARKWVSPKLPNKQAVRSSEASSNAKILEGIENKILRDAMLFELERKGIDLTKGVDLAAVEKAVKDINAEIPPGEDVMPNEFLNKYRAFLKHAEAIPGINELRSEFFVAVIAQNKSPIKEKDFSERIKAAKNYDQLNELYDEIGQAIKEINGYCADVLKARDAFYGYLPEDSKEIKSLDAESKRLFDLRAKYAEQNKAVAEARRVILFEQGAQRAAKVEAWMETETVSVEVVRISMVAERGVVNGSEKPKKDAAFVYRPSEINPDDRFEKISGKGKIAEALKSDDHVILVKNDSVSYTQPKDAEKLTNQQMKELVQKMVEETYARFKPEKASDITYEGSAELKKIAKELMKAEINRNALAKEDTAKKTVDPGSSGDFSPRHDI